MLLMIPKIIHQIWIQGIDLVPVKYKSNINKLKQMNSDFIYIMWDEISFLSEIKIFSSFIEKYHNYNTIQEKIDFAKLVILLLHGGIFIDIDTNPVKPLFSLFYKIKDYDFIVAKSSTDITPLNLAVCGQLTSCINNGIIISKKKTHILNYLINKSSTGPWTRITSGISVFNECVNSYLNNNGLINKSNILVLDSEYFQTSNFGEFKTTAKTYLKHNDEHYWVSTEFINIIKSFKKEKYLYSLKIFFTSTFFTFLLIILASIIFIYKIFS
jgi:hypothetical protein